MQGNWPPHTLLVGIQDVAAAAENSLEVSQMVVEFPHYPAVLLLCRYPTENIVT